MDDILAFIEKYKAFGGYAVAVAALIGPAIQFLLTRSREARQREFETYHRLINELVAPDEQGRLKLDRQVAIIFELRHYRRYHAVTRRILTHLDEFWGNPVLSSEIRITKAAINRRWFLRD